MDRLQEGLSLTIRLTCEGLEGSDSVTVFIFTPRGIVHQLRGSRSQPEGMEVTPTNTWIGNTANDAPCCFRGPSEYNFQTFSSSMVMCIFVFQILLTAMLCVGAGVFDMFRLDIDRACA